ncbi:hypothetical protein F2Q69_00027775 [Brassica cretica]|uniref:Uncharacterized protein n=1 Tax=Brassica cretica TaxID=69181 RepID=A0A8S9S4E0_BRACR|nr:hypothetical protein F2Q69_00027775 [Brassica cretica]
MSICVLFLVVDDSSESLRDKGDFFRGLGGTTRLRSSVEKEWGTFSGVDLPSLVTVSQTKKSRREGFKLLVLSTGGRKIVAGSLSILNSSITTTKK